MSQAASPIDILIAEHYRWGGVCDGWHLLKLPGLSVIQEYVPPGAAEVKHLHGQAHQFFFVLSGVASLEFESHTCEVRAGQGVHVASGVAHRFANRTTEGVSFLVISSPSTAGDRRNLE